jgi:hypothetical protein
MSWIYLKPYIVGQISKDTKSLFIVLFQSMICSLGFSVI